MPSSGPRYPASTDGFGDVGTAAWATVGNATGAPNDTYAVTTLTAAQLSEALILNNAGFAIPAGATINGVQVDVEAKRTGGAASLTVHLADGLNPIGAAKVLAVSTTEGVLTFGGAADVWSAALTATLVNTNGFGLSLVAEDGGASSVVSVDSAGITVTYTEASGSRATRTTRLGLGLGLAGGGGAVGGSGS